MINKPIVYLRFSSFEGLPLSKCIINMIRPNIMTVARRIPQTGRFDPVLTKAICGEFDKNSTESIGLNVSIIFRKF